MIHRPSSQSGFVILFAVVIATMVMLLAASIFRIALKETVLSSTATESQVALYMADSAMECVLYHEYVEGANVPEVTCMGTTFAKTPNAALGQVAYQVFPNPSAIQSDNLGCAEVAVERNVPSPLDVSSGITGTLVVSRGFNICDGGVPDETTSLLVERRLEAWFPNVDAPPTDTLSDDDGDPGGDDAGGDPGSGSGDEIGVGNGLIDNSGTGPQINSDGTFSDS